MITNNARSVIGMALQSSSKIYGGLPVTNVGGKKYYAHGAMAFPGSRTETYVANATAAGISLGTGYTPATKNDYQLESTITSGLTVSVGSIEPDCVPPGNPSLSYYLSIFNSTNDPIVIKEVGYKQTVKAAEEPGGAVNVDIVCLMDRTVLSEPLTIFPQESAVLKYTLSTSLDLYETKNGIQMASFTWATDEQFTALIEAAREGTIDLHEDAGWSIGDIRTIHISEFTADGITCPEQDLDIILTSFESYNGADNVLQFDFYNSFSSLYRLKETRTNIDGYPETIVHTEIIPKMIQYGLPSYLSSLLLPVSVKCLIDSSGTITTLNNVKMSLRAVTEIYDNFSYNGTSSSVSIGEKGMTTALDQIPAIKKVVKKQGKNGSNIGSFSRTPWRFNIGDYFTIFTSSAYGSINYGYSDSYNGLMLFGCL